MTPLVATLPGAELKAVAILTALLAVSAAMWAGICLRWRRGKPIIPLARRRPVPWQAQDLLMIFVIGIFLVITASRVVHAWVAPEAAAQADDEKSELAHPAEQMLRSGAPAAVAVAAVAAVVVAPLVEEFLFRVLLQGWLEAIWSRARRKHAELRAAPSSWVPIMLPAALFALIHARSSQPPHAPQYLLGLQIGQMIAELAALGLAILFLRFAVGATAADLGWKPAKLGADAQLGVLGLLAVIGPILTLQATLMALVKSTGIDYAPDPVPLFFLALVFGVLYQRTHRIAPSLVLHMAFNATAVVLMFAGT
jgi:membrane protease YdiL (CAAX protease family)